MNSRNLNSGQKINSGINVRNISKELRREEELKNYINVNTDIKNRQYIINLILKNIKLGKTEEQALEIAIKDEVAKEFEYLEKNGLNKKECFRNWSRGYVNSMNRKNRVFVR